MKIKQSTFEYIGHGRPEPATLSEVAGVVILEMWGGENTYTFQTVGMQNGRNDVSFVSEHHTDTSGWYPTYRTAREPKRVIDEASERLIAEHVYKALLRSSGYCCPECGAEDPWARPIATCASLCELSRSGRPSLTLRLTYNGIRNATRLVHSHA